MLAAAYFDWLYNALGQVLAFFYGLIPSYGFAIIMLTVTVRVLLIPLTAKQVKSQRAMQLLQPELKKLQQKYKGDRLKLNEEMMKLYKEHKANPLAGCLPLILQMPLFIVLYRIIIDLSKVPPKHLPLTSELYRALVESEGQLRSFGIDLADKPKTVLGLFLVAAVVASGYFQQKQMTARMSKDAINPQMQMITKIMPAFFGLISLSVPTGVVLYFITSNIWQIGQQAVAFRNRPMPGEAEADEDEVEPSGKSGGNGSGKTPALGGGSNAKGGGGKSGGTASKGGGGGGGGAAKGGGGGGGAAKGGGGGGGGGQGRRRRVGQGWGIGQEFRFHQVGAGQTGDAQEAGEREFGQRLEPSTQRSGDAQRWRQWTGHAQGRPGREQVGERRREWVWRRRQSESIKGELQVGECPVSRGVAHESPVESCCQGQTTTPRGPPQGPASHEGVVRRLFEEGIVTRGMGRSHCQDSRRSQGDGARPTGCRRERRRIRSPGGTQSGAVRPAADAGPGPGPGGAHRGPAQDRASGAQAQRRRERRCQRRRRPTGAAGGVGNGPVRCGWWSGRVRERGHGSGPTSGRGLGRRGSGFDAPLQRAPAQPDQGRSTVATGGPGVTGRNEHARG